MIPRYQSPEISHIWNDQNKFTTYLKVELALMKAQEGKLIPIGTSQYYQHVKIDLAKIEQLEKQTRHDVIAFCSSITAQVEGAAKKYFHFGITSSDIIDSATTLLIKDSLDVILQQLTNVCAQLKKLSLKYKNQMCMGRSHGRHAEPMSFGQKILGHYCEFTRRLQDLKIILENELTGQLSGAVGNYTLNTPEIELSALQLLGLVPEPVSTQIIPRDRIAKIVQSCSLLACAVERLATEIRLLHHSDIDELAEGFAPQQKGSSAMPHKKNPIASENLCGIARVMRSYAQVALENSILWHERDISHSSAERIILPDCFGLCFYMLQRLNSTLENIVIFPEKMTANIVKSFEYLSSYYLHQILTHLDTDREIAYSFIQKASFEAKNKEQFQQIIISEIEQLGYDSAFFKKVMNLSDLDIFNKHIEQIYKRCLS